MLQLPVTAQSRRNRSRLVGSVAGLAGFVALTGKAQARSNEDGGDALVALNDLPNVASVELRGDGSVLIRFEDGSTRILTAGEVIVENGVVYLDPAAQAEMALEGGSDLLLVGLGVAAVAGAVVLASDGGDEEPPLPVNTAPTITSAAAISVAENNTSTGLSVTATDAERDNVSFAIVGGADAALFTIDPASGALRFIAAPDFEVPADANGDNVFEVQVAATDGTLQATQTVLVTVTDTDDSAPVITSASEVTVSENSTAVVQATATDADSAEVTFSLSGADAALFAIDAATGVITFIGAPDFENPEDADADNVYQLVLTASDGVNSTTQDLTISVTDQNEVVGTAGNDTLLGSTGDDVIDGLEGDDSIDSLAGTDLVTGGAGADEFLFDLAGVDDGLTEDSITDFTFTDDRFLLDNASFNVPGPLVFMAVDANTAAPDAAAGANVIVLLNSDDDDDPATAFNARSAARQIDDLVDSDGPGFFVYSNSALGVNRLVYSENLNDGEAPLQIVARLTDLTGQDAIDALAEFSSANFAFQDDMPPPVMMTQGDAIGLPGEVNFALFMPDASAEGSSLASAIDPMNDMFGESELAAVAQINADALTGGL